MISFTVITDTPARLRDFLIARNIIKEVDDGQGGTSLVGVRPGMEWVRVPNPIRTDDINESPLTEGPQYDDRAVYLVKFAHESEDEEYLDVESPSVFESPSDEDNDKWSRSKFARWVRNNSTLVSAPANYTINGVHAGDAYKITGQQVWLVRDDPDRFGVWQ
jgi:hypothetical protein